MTAETSNAQGEWVLVPRELTQGMRSALARAVNASCNTDEWYAHTLAAAPPPPADAEVWLFKGTDGAWHTFHNEQHRLDTIADGRWDVRKFYALPPPAAAEPKTLPVPTRVYLTDKAAVIVGDPQRGWDEEGPEAHNCDDMGCSTIGPHVLARVPFTDERALSQPAEAQCGGEVVQRLRGVLQHAKMGNSYLISQDLIHKAIGAITAPPSAPVGVEDIAMELERYADCPGSVLALAGKLRALATQQQGGVE